ncbi:MAG: hypothetical protein LBR80_00385 [Deltaproteobacteria bacterium]|jgi:hypothetical protein|nr:hypothetical protein [Deltaproteobacteria bacterium]
MPLTRFAPLPLALLLHAALALALALPLSASAARAQQPGADQAPFTIETLDADTPVTAKYKAALRLFATVQAVYSICTECGSVDVWEHYQRRNGNTFNLVTRQFALGGGVMEAQKLEIDRYAADLRQKAYDANSCPGLLEEVRSQKWDIYKAERFSNDYDLVRAK